VSGQGFLLVYSVDNRATLDEALCLYDKVLRTCDRDKVPIVLVGNKCDLEEAHHLVTYEEGAALAKQWDCPFFETSAKTKINNEACYVELMREIRRQEAPVRSRRPSRKQLCVIL